jgi:hypothetical protein
VNTQRILRDDWSLSEHDCGTVIYGPEEMAFVSQRRPTTSYLWVFLKKYCSHRYLFLCATKHISRYRLFPYCIWCRIFRYKGTNVSERHLLLLFQEKGLRKVVTSIYGVYHYEARKVTRTLNSLLWNKHISWNTKKRIFCTVVERIVIYGIGIWTVDCEVKQKLLSIKVDFWRRAAWTSKILKVRYEVRIEKRE